MNGIETEKVHEQDQIILYFTKVIEKICSLKYLFWLNLGRKVPDFNAIDNSVNQQVHLIRFIETVQQRI
jgi:hypothetical protein